MLGERFVRPATPEEVSKETSLPFTRNQIEAISQEYPTPFYIYDERGIRENARRFLDAFSWAEGFRHITVLGKEGAPRELVYDITGSLCENNDKFAKLREFPEIELDDFLVVHEGGAHAIAMANEYNGRLIPKELLLKPDGSVLMIRRARTVEDYFSTIVNFPGF